jgi:hypothetical protein
MDANIQPGVIARVAGGISGGLRSMWNLWFPPLEPLPQVAPQGTPTRRFDYMVGENIQIQPHLDRFMQLRALADSYDLLRVVIETFKDHLIKVPWVIRPIVMPGQKRPKEANDPRVAKLTQLLSFPDGEQPWSAWLRALLEDALVIDAPTIEPILTRGGELVRLDLIDGATITPKIGYDGRLPKPPDTAYQQIVKGAPTVEFTADELIYYPRNRRTHKIYGYSPVEQITVMANLALRRELWLLNFFTEGSVPEAYLSAPESWTPDQIKQAQDALDSYLAGNLKNRRKIIIGPGRNSGQAIQLLKADAVGGDAVLDELIIRMICFAFNVSPQALVKMMNRATAQTAKAQAAEEGLIPWMMYIQELMCFVLRKYCKVTDLEFAWQDEKEEDPTAQAGNLKTLVSLGLMSPNEGRDVLGLDPVDGGDQCMVYTATGPVPLAGVQEQHELSLQQQRSAAVAPAPSPAGPSSRPVKPGGGSMRDSQPAGEDAGATPKGAPTKFGAPGMRPGKTAKLKGASAHTWVHKGGKPAAGSYAVDGNAAQRAAENRLRKLFEGFLAEQRPIIADQVADWYAQQRGPDDVPGSEPGTIRAAKAAGDKPDPPFDQSAWQQLEPQIRAELEIGFREAMQKALDGLKIDDAGMWEQVQPRAVEWAKARAAELITEIEQTTRNDIRALVDKALTDGLNPQQLKRAIMDAADFDPARAEMIARTELADSHIQGTLGGWKQSGVVVGSRWIADEDACGACLVNAAVGVVKLGDTFPSGDEGPTLHPNCECGLSPVMQGEEEAADADG